MINKKLKIISEFIDINDKVIDVGCDHALLDIYLVINKNVSKIIASDINKNPLMKAKENIVKYNVQNKIIVKQGNGLEPIEKDINVIVISGMGGITIADILKGRDFTGIDKIIVSANNNEELVRKSLFKLGFYPTKEVLHKEKNIIYQISLYTKQPKRLTNLQIKYGTFDKQDKLTTEYYNKLLTTKIKILKKIPSNRVFYKLKLKKEIINLKKMQ